MIRSMFSAISGLRNHQTMMDVVGNNISNVNTTGFKSSSVVFQDVLSQTLRGSGAAADELGGTNPAQVGLGAKVTSVTTNFTQGALQRTGRSTDLALQGDGFFTVVQAGQTLYTRAGNFSVDALGRLVTQEGAIVQGWIADPSGVVNTNAAVANLQIPVGDLLAPRRTSQVQFAGNLPAAALAVTNGGAAIPANGAGVVPRPPVAEPPGSAVATSVEIYDSLGNPVPVTLTFYKSTAPSSGAATWEVRATVPDPADANNVVVLNLPVTQLTFDAAGELVAPAAREIEINGTTPDANLQAAYPTFGGANPQTFTLEFGAPTDSARVTSYAQPNTVAITAQNGSAAGSLQSFTVSQDGLIVGAYSNGRSKALGQLAVANFANPEGLEKVGGSNFRTTVNSGLPRLGSAGTGGRGLLSSGTLEMSNVDLAQEFTNLIVAQRGFQANSRVVSSSDELLQDIVNLKR